jgi:putative phosphoesterase
MSEPTPVLPEASSRPEEMSAPRNSKRITGDAVEPVMTATIGIISDTHGLLRPEALAALRGSDFIIHAGDIGDEEILKKLEKIAPVTAVRGNIDKAGWARKLPPATVLEVGGVSIYVLHNVEDLDLKPEAAQFAAVIYGHSHIAKQENRNGVLHFNPGSAGSKRFRLPVSLGRLKVKGGKITAEIVQLDV